MIAFSYGRIIRATVARNPVAKGVLLPLKFTGLGLFLFKLRLHFSKPLSFSTKGKGYRAQRAGQFQQRGMDYSADPAMKRLFRGGISCFLSILSTERIGYTRYQA